MIWILFGVLLFLTQKNLFFFRRHFGFNSPIILIVFILPMVLLLNSKKIREVFSTLKEKKEYEFFLSLLLGSLAFSFASWDSFFYLCFYELTVLPMIFLFINFSKDYDKIESIFFMFLLNLIGSILFIYFCSIFCNLNFRNFDTFSCFNIRIFITFRFFLLFCSKFPLFFLHIWLTKAHVRAAGFCSMILASLILKLGTFGVFKFISGLVAYIHKWARISLSLRVLRSLTITLFIVRYFDIKFLVACSSVVHIAPIFPSLWISARMGRISRLLIILGHGLVSFFLFFFITLLYEASFSRTVDFNKRLESNCKTLYMLFFCCLILNLGFPPLVSFIRELILFVFFLKFSLFSLIVFCLAMLISIFYVIFFICSLAFGKKTLFTSPLLISKDIVRSIFIIFPFLSCIFLLYFFSF